MVGAESTGQRLTSRDLVQVESQSVALRGGHESRSMGVPTLEFRGPRLATRANNREGKKQGGCGKAKSEGRRFA